MREGNPVPLRCADDVRIVGLVVNSNGLPPPGQHVAVPIGDFTGTGRSPNVSTLYTPVAAGSFTNGQTSASLNLTFTNAALLKGTVRFSNQAPVTQGGAVYIRKSNHR